MHPAQPAETDAPHDPPGDRPPRRAGGAGGASWLVLAVLLLGAGACEETGPAAPSQATQSAAASCDLPVDFLWSSLAPDVIPALNQPAMVPRGDPAVSYLRPSDRVLGVVVDGEARAYPHNVLWHHEIINDRIGDQWVTVTFCPLTGSGLAFDASSLGGSPIDFGVSGLLFANNLVMYDRESGEIFGPQLRRTGTCGGFQGARLDMVPVLETSWARWQELHPATTVVGEETGFVRNYNFYPYQSYDQLTNDDLLFAMHVDTRRPIKERVLAVRTGERGGRGYPFGEFRAMGAFGAVNEEVGGRRVAVLWEAWNDGTARAYLPEVDGRVLTFRADEEGIVDEETGSRWTVEGRATAGELAGARLAPHPDSYVLFWFAWRFFQPDGSTFGMD